MSEIFNDSFTPPVGFTHEAFVIFPTDVSYFDSDYKTVMKCRKSLRLWSQSSWPEDSFTAEDNKQDLQHHVADNLAHSAYGYMIYTPDKLVCLGSLYVNPVDQILQNYKLTETERRAISQFDARIDFWTNTECDDSAAIAGFDSVFVQAVSKWFAETWKIRPAFSARRGMVQRERVYAELGLRKTADIFKVEADGSSVSLLLFN